MTISILTEPSIHTLSFRPRLDQLKFEFLQIAVGEVSGIHPGVELCYEAVTGLLGECYDQIDAGKLLQLQAITRQVKRRAARLRDPCRPAILTHLRRVWVRN